MKHNNSKLVRKTTGGGYVSHTSGCLLIKTSMRQTKMKLLWLLISLIFPLGIYGEGKTLVVELVNGKTEIYNLSEKPVLSVNGSKLKVETNMIETSYERAYITKFYFTDAATDISDSKGTIYKFSQTADDTYIMSNVSEKLTVTVYDISGKQFDNSVTRIGDNIVVTLNNCPKGIYIIKVGNKQNIKVIRK